MSVEFTLLMEPWTPPVIVGLRGTADDEALWASLGIETASSPAASQWQLLRDSADSALTLSRPDGVRLQLDFTSGKTRHRTLESGQGAQSLYKALGVKQYLKSNEDYPIIVDATGGLGQDAWALASTGCQLVIIERHPIVHALLSDAIERARVDDASQLIAERISLLHADAVDALTTSLPDNTHGIYLDPMYPSRRKKADSKKGMQFLHALLGPPPTVESPKLLLSALKACVPRVAVKRPKGAPLLAGSDEFGGQRTVIETANTRYDVYHKRV